MKTYEAYTENGADRAKDPARVQHDLQDILSEMGDTLEAIQERFSPGEMLDHLLRGLRGMGQGSTVFAQNLGRSIRDNPVPAALIGVGVGSLLFSRRRAKAEEAEEEIDVREGAREKLEDVREGAREKFEDVREGAAEVKSRAKERARTTTERARHFLRRGWDEQPLVFGAICAAVGALIGGSLPVTRREQEVLGPKAREAQSRLAARTEEAIGSAGEAVSRATEEQPSAATMPSTPVPSVEAQGPSRPIPR